MSEASPLACGGCLLPVSSHVFSSVPIVSSFPLIRRALVILVRIRLHTNDLMLA